jgi:DNA-binding response OmpR family regulator
MSKFFSGEADTLREGTMPRILVIDDDASMRESLKDLLSLVDFECDVADNGKMGLAMFQLNAPELVVLDAQLPDVSGFQLCQVMKKGMPLRQVPVVMVSGRFIDPQDRVQGLELGADDFFMKPFDPMLFVARLKNLLRIPIHAI